MIKKFSKLINESIDLDSNTLYYSNFEYGQIFWNSDNVISGIHENDGEYRPEYMDKLFSSFGINVILTDDIPNFVKEWDGYSNFASED